MNEPANTEHAFRDYNCPKDEYFMKRRKFSVRNKSTLLSKLIFFSSTVPMMFPEPLNTHTICLDTLQGENDEFPHFDVHSLYGLSESKPTLE